MSARSLRTVENFAAGVITSMTKDRLPEGASPYARNSQLYNIGQGYAIFGKRAGMTVQNKDNTSAGNEVIAQNFFEKSTGGVHLFVLKDTSTSHLKKMSLSDGTITNIGTDAFSVTTGRFSWATAKDLCFVVNGTDAKKTDGTSVFKFGIVAPDSTDFASGDVTVTTPGTGVIPADTYDIALTYYNSATGAESGRSTTYTKTVAATNKIQVVIPSSTDINDSQVTHSRIHIRRQSTQSQMFKVVSGYSVTPETGDTSDGDFAVTGSTRTVTLDCTAAQLLSFVTLTPGVNDNQPPPTGALCLAWHKSRMFAATDTDIYWTDVAKPEAFNLLDYTIPVYPDDGDPIVAIVPFQDVLVIFKATKMMALVGDDPQTWSIETLDDSTGCVALNSIGVVDNKLWWWSMTGPRMWGGRGSSVTDITTEFIAPHVGTSYLNTAYSANIEFVANPYEAYVGWAVPELDQSRLTHILPFNFKVNRWMSTRWDPCDIRSVCMIEDANDRLWIMLGDYDGFIYKLGTGGSDGIYSSFTTLYGTVTSSTNTTLTVSTATWATDGLKGRYVYVYPTAEGIRNFQRRRITANTGTQITVSAAWDANPDTTYTYVLGGVLFDWRSAWLDSGTPWSKKRLEFIYLHVGSPDATADFDLDVYTDNNESEAVLHKAVGFSGGAAVWDESLWDSATFAAEGSVYKRIRVGCVGKNYQIRLSNLLPSQRVLLYKFSMQAVTRTKKLDAGAQ
jgi:hypothetical protein